MTSVWQHRSFPDPLPQGVLQAGRAELLVVGAGIVGLCAALHYKRRHPRHRVLVLERGLRPDGASLRNAGFACFGSPSELLSDTEKEGSEAMLARVEERWHGLQDLRTELGDDHIGFEATGGYELFAMGDPLYTPVASGFDRLNELLKGVFGTHAYEWRDERIGDLGLRTEHLSFCPLEGSIDTGRMMRALLAKTEELGVELCHGQQVEALEDRPDGVFVRLSTGGSAWADRAVVATNGYAQQLLPGIDVSPARGQVLITSPVPGLRLKGTFHANEGFYYFRDLDGRVLLGGGRHLDKAGEATMEDATTPLIQADLERLLRETILPGEHFTIERRWSGVMGFRSTGKDPLVQFVSPRVVAAVGLSGMGVAIGIRVARRAAALLAQ